MEVFHAAVIGVLLLTQPADSPQVSRSRLMTGSIALPAGCRDKTAIGTDTIFGSVECSDGSNVAVDGGSLMPFACRSEAYEGSTRYLIAEGTPLRTAAGHEIELCVRGSRRDKRKLEFVAMIPGALTSLIADLHDPYSVASVLSLAASYDSKTLNTPR